MRARAAMRAAGPASARRAAPAVLAVLAVLGSACAGDAPPAEVAAGAAAIDVAALGAPRAGTRPEVDWNSGTIYFLLTDRFRNGDPSNDDALGRPDDAAVLRGFEGGDLAGVLEKLREGWFDDLGVTALWMTPFVAQNLGGVDEGTGWSYGYHGYWARDWTAVEPALGTADDLRAVVDEAHARGIRVIMDAVINHTGPATDPDPAWPAEWVRTSPRCDFRDYAGTVDCTLVANLPDVHTESDAPVELPPTLRDKWAAEGRLEAELAELDAWFERTGHPRAPRYYLVKWLTDWVREFGFDGYRVDTAKHFEESVSAELAAEARRAWEEWKAANPGIVPADRPFYMMAEVYNYESLRTGRDFDFGDRRVDFFDHGYDALIDFGFKWRAREDLDAYYEATSSLLREGALRGSSLVSYASSHDDGSPLDPGREHPYDTGTRLLLTPGTVQIYYGDEVARPLRVDGAQGDANLRSTMDWDGIEGDPETRRILAHWRTLARFRAAHPAVGAGAHRRLQAEPYVFSRVLEEGGVSDRVVVGTGQPAGPKSIPVGDVFPEGTTVRDAYGGATGIVSGGVVALDTPGDVVLLERVAA